MSEKIYVTDGVELFEVTNLSFFDMINEKELKECYKEIWLWSKTTDLLNDLVTKEVLEIVEEVESIDLEYSVNWIKSHYISKYGLDKFEEFDKELNNIFSK